MPDFISILGNVLNSVTTSRISKVLCVCIAICLLSLSNVTDEDLYFIVEIVRRLRVRELSYGGFI